MRTSLLLFGQAFICPSSSQAGVSFVGKMNGSLSTCMVYRGLSDITTKTCSPPPCLISMSLDLLHGERCLAK